VADNAIFCAQHQRGINREGFMTFVCVLKIVNANFRDGDFHYHLRNDPGMADKYTSDVPLAIRQTPTVNASLASGRITA
jgi:hypothetical protein